MKMLIKKLVLVDNLFKRISKDLGRTSFEKTKIKFEVVQKYMDDLSALIEKLRQYSEDKESAQRNTVALNDLLYDMLEQTKTILKFCLDKKLIKLNTYSSFKV